MNKNPMNRIGLAGLVLCLVLLACSSAQAITPTALPTNTSLPPTATLAPTATLEPSPTPDVAATQAYDDFYTLVQGYHDKGYFSSLDGSQTELDDFSESWPQIGWYEWWPSDLTATNFVYSGHFKWSVASQTPEVSGCGIAFGIQDDGSNYTFFLDKSRIFAQQYLAGSNSTRGIGKTRGTGRVNIASPYEADFSMVLNQNHVYVYVDKAFVGEYTLSVDANMEGKFGYTLLSGTNKDFGTKCEITNARLWTFNN